jgi:DNA (cytosine-5)-methyltransferase 1
MVRAAEVLEPEHVVIENVPGAARDRKGVVQRAVATLESLGYSVASSVFDAAEIGVPQRRRRLLVVASRRQVELESVKARHRTRPRTLRWAIGDLERLEGDGLLDEAAASAPATRRRIDYLFDHGLFDLPNEQRPACHANGGHSYRSIYGRLSWDEPAQTLTTGFYCMCMGRYVHPSKRRTLTAREAARLQFFPDWFDFSTAEKRGDLARLIGNAVPSKLGYVIGLELLR